MKVIYIQYFILLMLCFHILAQDDSCELQKQVAKCYASHIFEKDKYYLHSCLLGTLFPFVGPLVIETKALMADVKPLSSSEQSFSKTSCFKNEYIKRVKVERSKEVLKGGLVGAGASVFLYSIVLIVWVSFAF